MSKLNQIKAYYELTCFAGWKLNWTNEKFIGLIRPVSFVYDENSEKWDKINECIMTISNKGKVNFNDKLSNKDIEILNRYGYGKSLQKRQEKGAKKGNENVLLRFC